MANPVLDVVTLEQFRQKCETVLHSEPHKKQPYGTARTGKRLFHGKVSEALTSMVYVS